MIHALSGEQDLRKMGGLRTKIPWTFWTFAIGTVAIAGIPGFSGFFSKDMILAGALEEHRTVLFGVAFFTALLTAFYMARLLALAFLGEYRGEAATAAHGDAHGHDAHGGVHESPWVMLVPLVVLAVGSVVAGWRGLLDLPGILQDTFRVHADHAPHPEWLPIAAGAGAIAASLFGLALYTNQGGLRASLIRVFRPLAPLLDARYYFDQAYNWFAGKVVVRGTETVLWRGIDAGVIDAGVIGTATTVDGVSRGVRKTQSGLVRGYALLILGGTVLLLGYLLWM